MNLKQRIAAWIEQNRQSDDDQAALIADILYHYHGDNAAEMLDSAAVQYRMDEWIVDRYAIKNPAFEAKVKRDKGGRFAKQAGKSSESAKIAILKELKKPPTPKGVQALVDSLSQMTVKDLTQFKKEQGISASGRTKADLVAKIADRLSRGRREPVPQTVPSKRTIKKLPAKRKSKVEPLPEMPAVPPTPKPVRIDSLSGKYLISKLQDPKLNEVVSQMQELADIRQQADDLNRLASGYAARVPRNLTQKQADEVNANIAAINNRAAELRHASIKGAREILANAAGGGRMEVKSLDLKSDYVLKSGRSVELLPIKEGSKFANDRKAATEFVSTIVGANVTIYPQWGRLTGKERAFAKTSEQGIYCSDEAGTPTYVHELGHVIEFQIGSQSSKDFLDYRLKKSGTKDVNLADMFPANGYDENEYGNEDGFGPMNKVFRSVSKSYYIGKRYSHASTEVISMGVQALYENPTGFAKADPEYFKFMIGYLNGHI